jgi:hypothetical protein
MNLPGLVRASVAACVAVALLAGCSAQWESLKPKHDAILDSTVDPSSTPEFIDSMQDRQDVLPASIEATAFDASSSRYQGEWDHKDVYLALGAGGGNVNLIYVPIDNPDLVGTGSAVGNSVLAASKEGVDEIGLVYLPQGTTHLPRGWSALSDWVAVRK